MYFFVGAPLKGTPIDIMQRWKTHHGGKHSSLFVSDDMRIGFVTLSLGRRRGERERERERNRDLVSKYVREMTNKVLERELASNGKNLSASITELTIGGAGQKLHKSFFNCLKCLGLYIFFPWPVL